MSPAVASALTIRVSSMPRASARPVRTAGSTPAPPAVGAATMTPMAAFTSCTANARARISWNAVLASGPSWLARTLAASPPTRPEAECRSPSMPRATAPRMTRSARASAARMSSRSRPWSFASASSVMSDRDARRDSAAWIASASERNIALGPDFLECADPADPVERADAAGGEGAGRFVELDHHEGVAAAFFARDAHGGEVDALVGEEARDAGHRARSIFGHEDEGGEAARDVDRKAVDFGEADAARA